MGNQILQLQQMYGNESRLSRPNRDGWTLCVLAPSIYLVYSVNRYMLCLSALGGREEGDRTGTIGVEVAT